MLPSFPFLVYLHQLQSRVGWMRLLGTVLLAAFVIVYACNSSKSAGPLDESKTTGNGSMVAAAEAAVKKRNRSQATIQAPEYEVNLHWAIPFIPRGQGEGLVQIDSGSQFVLLDLSVKNTTSDRAIDMGQILLGAKIRDAEGREYTSDPLVIAAFNLEYPYPDHQAQYRSLKGILQPGKSGRTVLLGFQAPVTAKQFLLILEGTNDPDNSTIYKSAFCLR